METYFYMVLYGSQKRVYIIPCLNLVIELQLFEAVMQENASKWQAPGR